MENQVAVHITVMKFGGTSVEDGPAFERVAQIVRAHEGSAPVVIVSAMNGVTDALINSYQIAANQEPVAALGSLEEHFERHVRAARDLGPSAVAKLRVLVENARREIIELLDIAAANGLATLRTRDAIAFYGEMLSASLLTMVLEQHGLPAVYVDARRCILTDGEHGSANPLTEEVALRTRSVLKPLLEMNRVPVLGGFIGATVDGVTTTLGRGSSDYSATLIGAALRAREIQIWTDVDGLQTADPNLVSSARTVPKVSYEEAAQLARFGARVMHFKMIEPVVGDEISIRIRNSRAPAQSGTLICSSAGLTKGAVKAIAHRTNLTRIDLTTTPSFAGNGMQKALQTLFRQHRIPMDIIGRSGKRVTLTCEEGYAADNRLPPFLSDLERWGSVEIERDRAIIGCVGDGLRNGNGRVKPTRNILREIDPLLSWQSTAANNLIAIVDEECVGAVVRRLHEGIFERHASFEA